MTSIATLGAEGSLDWEAAKKYSPDAEIFSFPHISAIINAFSQGRTDMAIIPAYNTRDGENKEFLRAMSQLQSGCWLDNLVIPVHLSLGALNESSAIDLIIGKPHLLKQCSEFFSDSFPDASIMATQNLEQDIETIVREKLSDRGVIAPEKVLKAHGLVIREREVAPFNRTRYAILGRKPAPSTGYDATVMITRPLRDRVGLLYDILGEFSQRGISLLDMRTESDLKTQELLFYVEAEGHIDDEKIKLALERIENNIIQEPGAIRILGSFPRIDMRTKLISKAGFIGTGDMSTWFAERLENEGYEIIMTGRSTEIRPEDMINDVDVVIVCVPISATPSTIEQYGPMMKDGQALVIMAGEAENTLDTAMRSCEKSVEVMLVHNLWGPQAASMKDKNVSVVKTPRSGVLCSEFESFLYKHGSIICKDTPVQHDLLMGFSQKLPTAISMAMAMALKDNDISTDEIGGHSTLTSLYGLLAMCRVHAQNPRTYGEILSTRGAGRKIVRDFVKNLTAVLDLSEEENIAELSNIIEESREYLSDEFLNDRMKQALAVDETLGRVIRK